MMFVQNRRWDDRVRRFVNGKVHWMAQPWVTTCGQQIQEDWLLDVNYRRNFLNGCKKCKVADSDE